MAGWELKSRCQDALPVLPLVLFLFIINYYSAEAYEDGSIRLVGGRGKHEGTIVIYHLGYWGAVCDKEWDRNDGHVVCRQLGYIGEERVYRRSFYGSGRAWIWMSRVRCYGNEKRLDKCRFAGWGRSNCYGGRRSAGVRCIKPTTTAPPTTTTTPPVTTEKQPKQTLGPNVLLADEPASNMTEEVEETANEDPQENVVRDEESGISYTSLTSEAPLRFTRRGRLAAWRRRARRRSTTLPTTTTTILPDVRDYNVSDSEDTHSQLNITDMESYLAFLDSTEGPTMRLNGGRFVEEGRVEIKVPGEVGWSAVCGDTWGLMEGMVVCRELGFGYAKVTTSTSFYGGERMHKIYKHVKCTGKEERLHDCDIRLRENGVSCNFTSSIAGVMCTKTLPDLIPNVTILEDSAHLRDHHLYYLQCAMEENCLATSAYDLKKTGKWISSVRRLLRFSSVVHNRGTDDFRPIIPKERWDWHECHMHYHSMEVFAHYDITDDLGNKVAEGHKASFCLEDSQCDPGKEKKFQCKGFADQGISVNCSDNYLAEIDCQWIDITDLSPGTYTFRVLVNPEKRVSELNFENNLVSCDMFYSLYRFKMENCTMGPDPLSRL